MIGINITAVIVNGIFILIFVALGILFLSGKGAFLIAGYNTMNKADKDKIDKLALCKFMGKIMFAMGFCILFWVFSEIFSIRLLFYVGLVLLFLVIIFTLIYANTFNRFKK